MQSEKSEKVKKVMKPSSLAEERREGGYRFGYKEMHKDCTAMQRFARSFTLREKSVLLQFTVLRVLVSKPIS